MRLLKSLAAVLSMTSAVAWAYPDAGTCTGYCFTHDPSVYRRSDGKYFRFSTRGGIEIVTATNLAGPWSMVGAVMPNGSIVTVPDNKVLWAPDVSYIRGLYYLFYASSKSGVQVSALGYATSPSMEPGTWTDHGAILTSVKGDAYNVIDANLVNGTNPDEFYLSWGSYWQGIYQARVSITGSYVYVSGNQHQVAYNPSKPQTEGAFIYPKNGYYYLFLSVGVCCDYTNKPSLADTYHVNVCRSKSAAGPFVDKDGKSCTNGGGTTVLASHDAVYAPGGQGVIPDPTYGDVLYYHYLDPNHVDYGQAKFGWNTIKWVDGWPTI